MIMTSTNKNNSMFTSFAAGAAAGLSVDLSLFPLDTIKTRLQSKRGFKNAGGFKGVYKGIGPVALGSAPCAAIFFLTYDGMNKHLHPLNDNYWIPLLHMTSASLAETAVNTIKVPIEIVKQRRQTSHSMPLTIIRKALEQEGVLGLYRGFFSTVLRDIPFSVIQFPLWEFLKTYWHTNMNKDVTPTVSAMCGAISGAVAGGLTTPLDVAKTRIMLAEPSLGNKLKMMPILLEIYRTEGRKGVYLWNISCLIKET
uniref:Uncharacterized protein n=1 Tax=Clastoptera arizonana TaxID=38151 RepID=A0A1B6DNK2_9HEMI